MSLVLPSRRTRKLIYCMLPSRFTPVNTEVPSDTLKGFTSMCLWCTSAGGWRPVIDQKWLNVHLDTPHFCMFIIPSDLSMVKSRGFAFNAIWRVHTFTYRPTQMVSIISASPSVKGVSVKGYS